MERKNPIPCSLLNCFFSAKKIFLLTSILFFSISQAYALPLKSYEDWYMTQESLASKLWEREGRKIAETFLVKESESLPFDSLELYDVQRELSVVVEYAYRKNDLKKLDYVVSLLLPSHSWLQSVSVKSKDGNSFLADCWVTKGVKTNLIEEVFPGAESIKLQNASLLSESGLIMIEKEVVRYISRDGNNNLFLEGKIKEYHPSETPVYQLSENILNSSQFVYLLARTLNVISSLPPSQRTENMKKFLADFTPLVCNHLYRWQYRQSIPWWGNSFIASCSHYQRLRILYSGRYGSRVLPLKHKRVSDVDLWIIASTAEVLDSAFKDAAVRHFLERRAPGGSGSYFDLMRKHLSQGIKLVKQRTEINVPGFRFIFDRGTRKDHPDHLYACFYEEATRVVERSDGSVCYLPRILSGAERDLYKDANATFDIGHGMRLPLVFLSLYRSKQIVGEEFPDYKVMKALGAQFYEKVYNRSFSKPLFKVYLNGVNGWYRVGYAGRESYGIGPWGLSHVVFYGYYTLLIPFEPRLKEVTQSLVNIATDKRKKDFIRTYYSKICDESGKIYSHFYSKLIFGSTSSLYPPKN